MNIRLTASLCLASAASIAFTPAYAQPSSNATVYATGLEFPRGLKFGPDGDLYVAEAGTGGTVSTVGTCTQVVPPIGPDHGGSTGRISKVDRSGNRTTVASGFPSMVAAQGDLEGVDLRVEGILGGIQGGQGHQHVHACRASRLVLELEILVALAGGVNLHAERHEAVAQRFRPLAPNGLPREFRPGPMLRVDRKSWAPPRITRWTRPESREAVATVANLAPVLPLMTETDSELQGLLPQ